MPPEFKAKSELTRHVDEDQRLPKNYPATDVFIANTGVSHLSVNALEIEALPNIIARYREKLQGGEGDVAVCLHRIFEYNGAASNTAGHVTRNRSSGLWEFLDQGTSMQPAYKHRPSFKTDSHCGIEFIRALSELEALRVARRLAKKKFKTFKS